MKEEPPQPSDGCPWYQPPLKPAIVFDGQLCLDVEEANELLEYGRALNRWFYDWQKLCKE